jgi:hypothetical protein
MTHTHVRARARARTHTHIHTTTPSLGLPRSRDRPVAEICTRQHSEFTQDIHACGYIRTHNPSKRMAADLCAATGIGHTGY